MQPSSTVEKGTIRNMQITMWEDVPDWELLRPKLRFFAYGEEVCPSTGKAHKQAFAQAWKPMRFTAWKKLFPPKTHFEKMYGTFRENQSYCSKEGKYQEFGEKPNQDGVKTGVLEFKRKLDEGEKVMDVAEREDMFPTYLQYRNGLKEYEQHVRSKRVKVDRAVPLVYIRIGRAGTGKTRWLDEQFGVSGWMQAPDNTGQWFDGCDRDVIVFDDVEAGQIPPLSLWKRLCDRYPLQVPVKGGFIWWKPKVIVFTSNQHWNSWWKNISSADIEAIKRRICSCEVIE